MPSCTTVQWHLPDKGNGKRSRPIAVRKKPHRYGNSHATWDRRQHLIPQTPTRIGDDYITPAASVRDLGIYIDSDVSMKSHVSRTVSTCFAAMRQIRSIRHCVPRQALVSLVLSWVDYGNATLAGVPAYAISRLQSVLNAAARLVL